jgi:hypothetical protein
LAPHAPSGLAFLAVDLLPEGSAKARVLSVSYEAPIPPPQPAELRERIEHLLASSSRIVERGEGRAAIDLRPLLLELALDGDVLKMRLRVDSRGGVGPRDVLATLGLADIERRGSRLRRTAVEIACSSILPNKKETIRHETGNADQRRSTGGMPHCDR